MTMLTIGVDDWSALEISAPCAAELTFEMARPLMTGGRVISAEPWRVRLDSTGDGRTELPPIGPGNAVHVTTTVNGLLRFTFAGYTDAETITLVDALTTYRVDEQSLDPLAPAPDAWAVEASALGRRVTALEEATGAGDLVTEDQLADAIAGLYTRPADGIPRTDLDAGVQASLTAADSAIPAAEKGTPSGVASLDDSGKVPQSQIPAIAWVTFLGEVGSQAEMLTLEGQRGDWCTRTDRGAPWYLVADDPTLLSSWRETVGSVAGRTGAVTLTRADVGLGQVDNTFDRNKPVSGPQQLALDGKMSLTMSPAVRAGLIGWAFDPATAVNSTAPTAGQMVLVRVWAEVAASVTTVTFGIANSPAGVAGAFVGLYDAQGQLLSASDDASALLIATTGVFAVALPTAVPLTANQDVYAAFLVRSATTMPALARGTSTARIALDGTAPRFLTSGTALTALPTTINLAAAGLSSTAFYASIRR